LIFAALVIGALRITNTWDFPTYLLLGLVAIVLADRRWMPAIVKIGLLIFLTFWLYRPFDHWYGQGYNRVEIWSGSHTPIGAYLMHWGLFLFIFISWLIGTLVRKNWSMPKYLVLIFTCGALILTFMVELIVLQGDIGRMNTVFKFYLQSWTLLAVGCGCLLVWLVADLFAGPRILRWGWIFVLIILFGLSMVYPITATFHRIQDRMISHLPYAIDGMAYMRHACVMEQNVVIPLNEDARAIRWMQKNVAGSPVIVEACTLEYHWGGRFSIYTGLPAVIGWNWHQRQQRNLVPESWVTGRIEAVRNFYMTTDIEQARDFLRQYRVRYIIVGRLERALYAGSGLYKFDAFKDRIWHEVYRNGETAIYEVKEPVK